MAWRRQSPRIAACTIAATCSPMTKSTSPRSFAPSPTVACTSCAPPVPRASPPPPSSARRSSALACGTSGRPRSGSASASTRRRYARWLADAPALLLVGLRVRRSVGDMPQLCDRRRRARAAERARLPPRRNPGHARRRHLVRRARPASAAPSRTCSSSARCRATRRAELATIAELLDAAARGPEPAPRVAQRRSRCWWPRPSRAAFRQRARRGACAARQRIVRAELARATRVRPRARLRRRRRRVRQRLPPRRSGRRALARPARRHRRARRQPRRRRRHGRRHRARRRARGARSPALRAVGDEGTTLLDPDTWAAAAPAARRRAAAIERIDDGAVRVERPAQLRLDSPCLSRRCATSSHSAWWRSRRSSSSSIRSRCCRSSWR